MTFFQWRRFNFFDLSRDVDEGEVEKAMQGRDMTAFASGRGHLVFGDDDGQLHFLTRHFKVSSLKAFQRRIHLIHQVKQSGVLLAVGEDDPTLSPCLKVFNLDKPDKQGSPSLVRTTRLALAGKAPSRPVCLAAHENQTLMAIGFEDGTVVLYRGDITRDRGTKQKVILQGSASVSGLSFRSTNKDIHLYVATTNSVFCYVISAKDAEKQTHLDNVGCPQGVAISADSLQDTHFITGRKDAVYCYTAEGRGQCYAFEGDKVALHWFRNYLVVVSLDSTAAATPTTAAEDFSSASSSASSRQTLTIFDVQNKFIAFTAPVRPVKALVSEWGLLFAITADNRIMQLAEKDIQSKLDLLFKKNFYDVAVKVAKMQQYDEEGLVDIFRQYGDHLYSKGDFSGSIENYVKTIGHLEPSYIIRKFLDAHKIHFLTEYLQALHTRGLANEDHTTLLLNCYTKLKDTNKLDDFIFKDREDVDFDVEIAIKVCRQSGYSRHALVLAEKHQKHEWYLRMQIEDSKGYKEALSYISQLDFDSAEYNMKKYGSALMKVLPDETTELLKKLCTDYRAKDAPLISEAMLDGKLEDLSLAANPEQFLHLFVKNSDKMVDFLEYMVSVRPDISGEVYTTLLEHYLHQCAAGSSESQQDTRKKQEDKVMAILRNSDANYYEDQALILCQRHSFVKGALFLFEKQGLYGQILGNFIDQRDIGSALQTCRKFGPQDPDLWIKALQYISRDDRAQPAHVEEILKMIEKHRLLSPMLVVSTLAKSLGACMGLARAFLRRTVEIEDKQMGEDQGVIDKYISETKKMRETNESLRTKPTTFQVSKCVACHHPLELPCVFFLCQHCYHQQCFQSFSETETECPACQPENKKILDIINSQRKQSERHDDFHHQLEKSDNSFAVVADYFGRGMFRRPLQIAELNQQMKDVALINQSFMVPAEGSRKLSERLDVGPGAEARIRSGETRGEKMVAKPQLAEARLRAETKQQIPKEVHQGEGRLRAEQASSSLVRPMSDARIRHSEDHKLGTSASRPISDARMRQFEGDRSRREVAGSLDAHMTRNLMSKELPMPRKKKALVEKGVGNPFGNQDELGEGNPFAEGSSSEQNPFGDPDNYDDSLNPFGTS